MGKHTRTSYAGAGVVPRGVCRWCGHRVGVHRGVSPEVKARPDMAGVRWAASACSLPDCRGCRRYE